MKAASGMLVGRQKTNWASPALHPGKSQLLRSVVPGSSLQNSHPGPHFTDVNAFSKLLNLLVLVSSFVIMGQ